MESINKIKQFLGYDQTSGYANNKHYAEAQISKALLSFGIMEAAGTPDIMLGILPVYKVQSYEVGRSLEVLKFRAAKGQFFKQQEGHDVSLRIDLILTGPYREIYLSLLEWVYIAGNTKDREVLYRKLSNFDPAALGTDILDVTSFDNIAGSRIPQSDIDKNVKWSSKEAKDIGKLDDTEMGGEEWHDTFVFMSETDILFDMYIENMITERSVAGGYNAIYISLFCRKFYPPDILYIQEEEKITNKYDEAKVETKTYRGRDWRASGKATYDGKTYYPKHYTGANGKTKFHNVVTFHNKLSPEISQTTKGLYGTDYVNTTNVIDSEAFKPTYSDEIDFAIRAAWRLLKMSKRRKAFELNFVMTETGILPWNIGVDVESTKIPEVEQTSIEFIDYKDPIKDTLIPEIYTNKDMIV